ncbi:MAG: hypothetical protein COA58_01135 [Bacteroidetes bacterium]|nr:MAG: hypothetical protein COA58_01135 [Bacteroidota bacterium]
MVKVSFLTLLIAILSITTQAQSLNLGVCDSMPDNFYKMKLTQLSIENGQGYCASYPKYLDKRISKFKELEDLTFLDRAYFAEGEQRTLPEEICELKQLKKLKTNAFNKEVFELKQLEVLELILGSNTELVEKEGFKGFKELHTLKLAFFYPEESMSLKGLAKLPKLETIELRNPTQNIVDEVLQNHNLVNVTITQTKGLTFDFSGCPNIKWLNLDFNELEEVPASVYGLRNLEVLSLTYNKISVVDGAIGELKKLTNFSLFNNQLTEVPEELTQCWDLVYLMVDNNPSLTSLPQALGALKKLQHLSASHCNLVAIPNSLGQCNDLRLLNVSKNKLEVLDLDFSGLHKLVNVKLSKNQLKSIPSSFFTLPLISDVDLSENKLTSLPNELCNMRQLVSLSLFSNELRLLPEDIGHLEKLELLSVYYNNLEFLPASIGRLNNLRSLYVGMNNIKVIPESYKNLVALQAFEIQENPLTTYPSFIYDMHSLDRVWVSFSYTKLPGYKVSEENPKVIVGRDKEAKQEDDGDFNFVH